MIHADLEAQKKVWYDIGFNNSKWSEAQYQALKALDRYQQEQVLEANKKGILDRFGGKVL